MTNQQHDLLVIDKPPRSTFFLVANLSNNGVIIFIRFVAVVGGLQPPLDSPAHATDCYLLVLQEEVIRCDL